MPHKWVNIIVFLLTACCTKKCFANLPPVFTQDMNNIALSESTEINTTVYTLEGYDPEGSAVTFGLIGSENFAVVPETGRVTIVKRLDREKQDTLTFLVSIKDKVNGAGDSANDNLVEVPISVIVLDENDNPPEFQSVPYETDVLEDAVPGTTIFDKILVTDKDSVGENLDVICLPPPQNPEACEKFSLKSLESNQDTLRAAVVLKDKLDFNERMIYQVLLLASDGMHNSTTSLEIHVKDVQNSPPVFQGSLAAVIDEDSAIGTLVMTVRARDGDRGQPRKIVYELMTNPMDYFLLDAKTGELRTAKPLDKEALPDDTGLVILTIKARELIDGVPGIDDSTVSTTQASVTIRDVNDSPPMFNRKEYFVSLPENTAPGTPLPIDMNVHDPDVGNNAIFSLRLDDVSEVFDVEPKLVTGSSQVSIRVGNGTLDYENPNQRKFIVLVIAEETMTFNKLSSTATLTISVTDANDNRPVFEQESYSTSVSETAHPGQLITTITAKDMDSGLYGDQGIRYSLSGTGAELFDVDSTTGAITVAKCASNLRAKRQVLTYDELNEEPKKVNITYIGQTGVVDLDTHPNSDDHYNTYELDQNGGFNHNEYPLDGFGKGFYETTPTGDVLDMQPQPKEVDVMLNSRPFHDTIFNVNGPATGNEHLGKTPCLDYETQAVYFLSYKATDDEGRGQTTVVSLRITLTDANDSPPVCESPLYRASLDEGAQSFDPALFIKARDPDVLSEIVYSIVGNEAVKKYFEIDKRSGQLSIIKDTILDVNHLNSENVFFSIEASDGHFSTLCNVNITIRDVNNHAPQFTRNHFLASVEENAPIGTEIEQLIANDLDTGINAEIRYRIQQGSSDDFTIHNKTGLVTISRKLDYDRRNTYQMEVVASDMGTPSLSGTATLVVSIINSNDKAPYFTPTTQRTEISEDAPVGTIVHMLVAVDPDIASSESLDYAATEPITAVDKDGKEVTNTDEYKDMFSVDRAGKVMVNKRMKRDLFAVIRITVLVSDTTAPTIQQGKGLLIITIIDVNEQAPVFALPWTPFSPKYEFQLNEEQPIGTILTTLQATDADSTISEYKINDNKYFEINNITGLIKTQSHIDYEQIKEIKFMATVTDTGIPQLTSTAEIVVEIININDNDPVFDEPIYNMNVMENSPKGTFIGQIQAKDNDDGIFGQILYSLVGEGSENYFVDTETGKITVLNSAALDREVQSEVSLTGVAQDKAPLTIRRSTTVPVKIKIIDVNDNAPIFSQHVYHASVAENAALHPPAAILQVNAIDKDESQAGVVKYSILNGNDDNIFMLDHNSGILYPAVSLSGKKGKYKLHIEARDELGSGPNTDTADVVIDVQSINQHRPIFVMPALSNATVEIPENLATSKYLVMTVKASDNDSEENGRISYFLQVNNENVLETEEFIIDEVTGELKMKMTLNRKQTSRYELILVARDHGTPSWFETLRFLTILLVDINESHPEFPDASNPYKFFVTENGAENTRIGKIQAIIQNNGNHHSNVYYYILLGNEDGAFYLDKTSGDVFTNKSLDREINDMYVLYVLASKKSDLHISEKDQAMYSIQKLDRDSTVAKVYVTILDVNDNPPVFEKDIYYAGVNSKAAINEFIALVNATDKDLGANATVEMIISASYLYKYGATKSTGSIVPSPFAISKDGRITTATYMAEYNQDRFILEIIAKEVEAPERIAKAKLYIWIFQPEQLVRVILSRPPSEVHIERDEIVQELRNATQKQIIVDEIGYHIDGMGRIRMDWCDMYFHAIDMKTQQIVPVNEILKIIDSQYDFLKDYYAGFAIENVVPAYTNNTQDEFDLALAAIVALLIVLFVGAVSFVVLCCCLKHWVISIPNETRRKDALIKKQIIEDLNTTENPLWIEQKLKLYEEQELTMQVFSEPEMLQANSIPVPIPEPSPIISLARRDSYEISQAGDNTYATIQPRNQSQMGEVADYATLTNTRAPSLYEFRGSTFQVQQRDQGDYVTELI